MKKIFLFLLFACFMSSARAEIKDYVYDGKEIYLHVKRDHVTTVVFPEPVTSVVRGFGADTYVVRHNDKNPNVLELMPTANEVAEMTVSGMSGEDYVLRCVANDNFYTKMVIQRLAVSVGKDEDKVIAVKMDTLPESTVERKETHSKVPTEKIILAPVSVLPPQLNAKITLKGNDLPLKIYFSTISQVTGYNIITSSDIDSQKTSINLENIEVWRALKSLLYKFGYGFKVSQDDLIITETETRIFNINMPAVDQSFTDETSNQSYTSSENNNYAGSTNQNNQDIKVGTKIYYENASPKLSLWSDLENNIKSLITPKIGSYSINKVSGSIIVTDKPAVLDKINELVSTINENLGRQQSFEIQIIEVTLSANHESGIDWNVIGRSLAGLNNITASTNFNASGFLSGQLLTLSATGPDAGSGTSRGGVSLMLKALDAMGNVNVISKPSITVSNMFPAVIQEVTSIPYISGTGQTIGNNIAQSNVVTSQVSDGLTMRLEAKIEDKKTVLNISAALNTLDSLINVPAGNGLTIQEPQVSTKSITTNVGIEPGKTLILGGLISGTRKNSRQGVPFLDRIPVLGNIFQFQSKSNQRTELVILITPKNIIKNI
ncbi:MAG: secretin N-terminal domain-containing protein [Candidatus Omnitrophica bacterium]|nr:secretin N-terminal domain-containing protein [Candidatus Omnitrophota bacterium]